MQDIVDESPRKGVTAGEQEGNQSHQRHDTTEGRPGPLAIKLLIVEDNPGDVWLAKRMLASNGVAFQITHVLKLSSALEHLRLGTDVVLLDLDLPDSQGLDTLLRVRAQEPSVPIIILTGREDRDQALDALNKGAQEYLIKAQVDGHLLVRTILRQLKQPAPS